MMTKRLETMVIVVAMMVYDRVRSRAGLPQVVWLILNATAPIKHSQKGHRDQAEGNVMTGKDGGVCEMKG